MEIFRYTTLETDYLSRRDPVLGEAIRQIGPLERAMMPDLFQALAHSIVGQQITDKTARTVWGRLEALCGGVTPAAIAAQSEEALRSCGMSQRKVMYLQGAAAAALEGTLAAAHLAPLSDEEVVRQLTALPGVGRWTAEMLMLFSLGRPDVVSFGDLAIRRGIMRLYGLSQLTRKEFKTLRARWSPYGSVASFYLWAVAHDERWADSSIHPCDCQGQ